MYDVIKSQVEVNFDIKDKEKKVETVASLKLAPVSKGEKGASRGKGGVKSEEKTSSEEGANGKQNLSGKRLPHQNKQINK